MRTALALVLLTVAGCSDNTVAPPPPDMSAVPHDMAMAIFSCCGQPGDKGNSLGVGEFCNGLGDCDGSKAKLCANLGGDPKQHFCTFLCTPPGDGGTDPCGENAFCGCQGMQCGCYPVACTMNPPDGC